MRDPARRFFEKYSAETNGEYSRCRITVKPGGGVPLRYHVAFTETFSPVKGSLGIVLGNETRHLKPGETAVTAQYRASFLYDGDEDIEFAVELRPAHQGLRADCLYRLRPGKRWAHR